jgi:hypothetical protein
MRSYAADDIEEDDDELTVDEPALLALSQGNITAPLPPSLTRKADDKTDEGTLPPAPPAASVTAPAAISAEDDEFDFDVSATSLLSVSQVTAYTLNEGDTTIINNSHLHEGDGLDQASTLSASALGSGKNIVDLSTKSSRDSKASSGTVGSKSKIKLPPRSLTSLQDSFEF